MEKASIRKSNIELIRIIAMVMIVMSHYVQQSVGQITGEVSLVYSVLSRFLGSFGQIGVSLFFMITGYFMINSNIKLKSIVKIIINTLFYSWVIAACFIIFFPHQITFVKIYHSLLPICTGQYWFITTYIIIYLLSPLINLIINTLEKEKLDIYLLVFFILWFVIPPLGYKMHFAGDNALICIYVYCIGAYIKKYGLPFFNNRKKRIFVYLISSAFVIVWLTICYFLHFNDRLWWHHLSFLNSAFVLLPAISVFYYFKNINLEYNRFINFFASSALSVYLITENIWMRKILWINLFHSCDSVSCAYLVCNITFAVITSYIFCILIDKLKDFLFINKLYDYVINNELFIKINKLANY